MNSKKRVMITGSNGFVGKSLVEKLSNMYEIYPVNRKTFNMLDENLVEKFINENKIETIIHCANVGGTRKSGHDENDIDIVQQNLKMFFNITRCLKPEMHMIHLGSGAEYDKSRPLIKVKEVEFDQKVPNDPYGYSKYVMSKYIEKARNITCLRIFGLYGANEDYTFKFISNSIIKNIFKMPIVINQNVIFDYLYIDDFVKIISKFIENKPNDHILNITPIESIDLVEIANIINQTSDYKSEIIILNEGLNKEYTGNNGNITKNIRDCEFTSYESGIKELYNHYLNRIKEIDIREIRNDSYFKYCKVSKK